MDKKNAPPLAAAGLVAYETLMVHVPGTEVEAKGIARPHGAHVLEEGVEFPQALRKAQAEVTTTAVTSATFSGIDIDNPPDFSIPGQVWFKKPR